MSMSMSRPGPPPLSPLSMSSNDSGGPISRYNTGMSSGSGPGSANGIGPGTPNDVPYNGGPYNAARPIQTSPPSSIHPGSSDGSSRPSGTSGSNTRPPSSASSVGMMSSDGRSRGRPGNRDSSRSQIKPEGEDALQRHYIVLKGYLAAQLQDEKGNIKPNRARDKLLRLSATQFMELSTDVYDELLRREDDRTQRVENVPRFLLPKQNFHPKRNQARQKLSTLPIERFRQLATDVFFELERRIPRFAGSDAPRPMSSASSGGRAPSRGGMRPPPASYGQGFPPGPGGPRRPYYPPGSPGVPPPGARRPSEAGSLGRPLPKTFQSSTIVPNKSTMVEDDEEEGEEYDGLNDRSASEGGGAQAEEDRAKIESQESEIVELKEKIGDLEMKLEKQESDKQGEFEAERASWTSLREELEQKALDAQTLNTNLQKEIDQLRQSASQPAAPSADYGQRIALLEDEIAKQETTMHDVREEATQYLKDMRALMQQNDAAVEQEERLATRVAQLEKENTTWRQRYAQAKAQNASLRASTMGLGILNSTASSFDRHEDLVSPGGLVRDTDVTRFQVAVDDLLRVARNGSSAALLDSVKAVAISVSAISSAVGTDGYPTPSPSPLGPDATTSAAPPVAKLKARVTGTANSLITAAKQHAAGQGLSPVVLLDAAASNLTAAIVQLIKSVHIRPSSQSELQDLDVADDDELDFYNVTDDHDSAQLAAKPQTLSSHVYSPRTTSSSSPRDAETLQAIASHHSAGPPPPPPKEHQSAMPTPALSSSAASATTPTTPNPSKKVHGGWFAWGNRAPSEDSSIDGSSLKDHPAHARGASAASAGVEDDYDHYR